MTVVRGRKRNRNPVKKLDLNPLRRALKDHRVWSKLAVVIDPDGDARHFELVTEDGVLVDIIVEVETVPDRVPLSCRLSGGVGGEWRVPAIGEEVVVCVPDGMIDFQPTIVAVLSSNEIPNPVGQGPAAGRTIITNSEIFAHDGTGGAQALPTKADYDALKAKYDGHKHAAFLGGTASVAGLTSSPASDPTGTADPLPAGTFTTVFKAK